MKGGRGVGGFEGKRTGRRWKRTPSSVALSLIPSPPSSLEAHPIVDAVYAVKSGPYPSFRQVGFLHWLDVLMNRWPAPEPKRPLAIHYPLARRQRCLPLPVHDAGPCAKQCQLLVLPGPFVFSRDSALVPFDPGRPRLLRVRARADRIKAGSAACAEATYCIQLVLLFATAIAISMA